MDWKTVRKDLRRRGRLIKRVLPHYTSETFNFMRRATQVLFEGRWLSPRTKMQPVYIDRPDGTRLRMCVITSRKGLKKDACAMMWIHGGGYASGQPEQDFAFVDRFAADGDAVVLSPDYRLSVDAPYPAGFDDCYAALLFLRDHARELGAGSDRILIGGDSAGGGMTAAVCLRARDTGDVRISWQLLAYPMLDDRLLTESSRICDGPVWDSKSNALAWKIYLRGLKGCPVPSYAAPAREDDLSRLPPAAIYVGSEDPFRDEAAEYAERLRAAGVPVQFRLFSGCYHGFDIVCPGSDASREAREFSISCFREAAIGK